MKNSCFQNFSKINQNSIDFLSIDIDGNDYWILKEINNFEPDIIICEYNAVFGNKDEITVQYKNNFDRTKFHYSNLAFGASLPAFINLLKKKNYYSISRKTAKISYEPKYSSLETILSEAEVLLKRNL